MASWLQSWAGWPSQRGCVSQPALAAATAQSVDQQHAFDFHFGTWRTHILSRASATKWVRMTGTVIDQPLWGGKANLEKIEASGAGSHFQGVTLFLYSPKSGQWSQTFASSSDGIMQESAYGKFKNGRGVFYAQSGAPPGQSRLRAGNMVEHDGEFVSLRDRIIG